MSKFDVKDFKYSAQTVEEYDAVLEAYKISNPKKYAEKLARGEFKEFRNKLAGEQPIEELKEDTKEPVEEPKEVAEKPKVVKPANRKVK